MFLFGQANADEFGDTISRAQKAMEAGQYAEVSKEVKAAKKIAHKVNRIIPSEEFVQLYFLEGLSLLKEGKSDEAIPFLRETLIANPSLDFTNPYTNDPAYLELFLSIQSEVSYRKKMDISIPESYGAAEIYIDGQLKTTGDKVPMGEHLAQIKCPKGEVFSKWNNFNGSFNWIKMCPYKFDLRKPCPEPNDDPLALNPFEEIPEHCVEGAQEEPPQVVEKPKEEVVVGPTPQVPDLPAKPAIWSKVNKPLLIGSVVTAITAGTIYYFAVQERSKFDNMDDGMITNIDELSSLRDSINTKVYLSAGLGVTTVGLYAGAFWKVRF
jgi:tetratricopeptide (TPR) repeat protein